MDSIDREVLERTLEWTRAGHRVSLVTVIQTWGSAPRPPGALLAICDDGRVVGSVSGGCVEDDMIDRVRKSGQPDKAGLVTYGVSRDEAARFGLPCGGTLELVQEPVTETGWIEDLLRRTATHELIARCLDLQTGKVTLESATRGEELSFDARQLRTVFGPRYRPVVTCARADGRSGRFSSVRLRSARGVFFDAGAARRFLSAWHAG
jgi:xanthine dehydrogenase accessory factor